MEYRVTTERLGLPAHPNWRERHGWSLRQQYEVDPDAPTATCHIQLAADQRALCGYAWESLVAVPGSPEWTDVDPMWRCAECTELLMSL